MQTEANRITKLFWDQCESNRALGKATIHNVLQVGKHSISGPVFSYKLRYIVGFWLVEMAISNNRKPTIYRNLYENTGPEPQDVLNPY